jgi:hypothetical protein
MPYLNRSETARVVELLGELTDIAARSDMDTAAEIMRSVCGIIGADPLTDWRYRELVDDIYVADNARMAPDQSAG